MSSEEEGASKNTSNVRIDYKKSDLHRVVHVNGVYGGRTPRGELAFDFTSEYMARPSGEVYEVEEDGSLGDKVSEEGGSTVTRERNFTAIISPNNTRSIAELMLSKVFDVKQEKIHELLSQEFD